MPVSAVDRIVEHRFSQLELTMAQTQAMAALDKSVRSEESVLTERSGRSLFWELIGTVAYYRPLDLPNREVAIGSVCMLPSDQEGLERVCRIFFRHHFLMFALDGNTQQHIPGMEDMVRAEVDRLIRVVVTPLFDSTQTTVTVLVKEYRSHLLRSLHGCMLKVNEGVERVIGQWIEQLPSDTAWGLKVRLGKIWEQRRAELGSYESISEKVAWLHYLRSPETDPVFKDLCLNAVLCWYDADYPGVKRQLQQMVEKEQERALEAAQAAQRELLEEESLKTPRPKRTPKRVAATEVPTRHVDPLRVVSSSVASQSVAQILQTAHAPLRARPTDKGFCAVTASSPTKTASAFEKLCQRWTTGLAEAVCMPLHDRVSRWHNVDTVDQVRPFSDRTPQGSSVQRYAHMDESSVYAQIQRHYFPGLSRLLQVEEIKKGYFHQIKHSLVVKVERWDAQGNRMMPLTLMTVGVNPATGVLYHAFAHPSEEWLAAGGDLPLLHSDVLPSEESLHVFKETEQDQIAWIAPQGNKKMPLIRLGQSHPSAAIQEKIGYAVLHPF